MSARVFSTTEAGKIARDAALEARVLFDEILSNGGCVTRVEQSAESNLRRRNFDEAVTSLVEIVGRDKSGATVEIMVRRTVVLGRLRCGVEK